MSTFTCEKIRYWGLNQIEVKTQCYDESKMCNAKQTYRLPNNQL